MEEIEILEPYNFFQSLDEQKRAEIRAYEKVSLKIISTINAQRFNKNCIRERLCPKGINKRIRTTHCWIEVEKILHQRIKDNEIRLQKLESRREPK